MEYLWKHLPSFLVSNAIKGIAKGLKSNKKFYYSVLLVKVEKPHHISRIEAVNLQNMQWNGGGEQIARLKPVAVQYSAVWFQRRVMPAENVMAFADIYPKEWTLMSSVELIACPLINFYIYNRDQDLVQHILYCLEKKLREFNPTLMIHYSLFFIRILVSLVTQRRHLMIKHVRDAIDL